MVRCSSPHVRRLLGFLLLCFVGAVYGSDAVAAPPDKVSGAARPFYGPPPPPPSSTQAPFAEVDAGVTVDAALPSPPESPAVVELHQRAASVRALLAGSLDVALEPATLFDVLLHDEVAVRVEVERLRTIVDAQAQHDGGGPDAGAEAPRSRGNDRVESKPKPVATSENATRISSSVSPGSAPPATSGFVDAGAVETLSEPLDTMRWQAQLDLDRAHLAFLELSKLRRGELLSAHAQRQRVSTLALKKRELTDAEQAARQADQDREKALLAAKQARTEAARLVAEERARLLSVIKRQAEFEAALAKRDMSMTAAKELTLKLQREVREAAANAGPVVGDRAVVDALYHRLRQRLRNARSELAVVTSALASTDSAVPTPGGDRLDNLQAEVNLSAATALRQRATTKEALLQEAERDFTAREAQQLYTEVETLNADRLTLLPFLSVNGRRAVTGFGQAGLDQAAAEVRQVVVVLRYHAVATLRWVAALMDTRSARGRAAFDAMLLAIRAIPPLLLFLWWRRRAERTLASLKEALAPERDRAMPQAGRGQLGIRVVNLLVRIQRPLEWLLLIFAVHWLLPLEITSLLEFTLPLTIFTWTLGGALVVLAIDFLAGEREQRTRRVSRIHTSHIRLRSLRLVGRVVVAFGLILNLTSQLVGEGTIYGWVWRLCWFAAVPIVLVLVKWWRIIIVQRMDAKRKKTAVEHWIVTRKSGWQSFVAALLGGALLVAGGIYHWTRAWISSFNVTRRILAYLFRREINKKAETGAHAALEPLSTQDYEALSPATPSQTLVPSVADGLVAQVIERIKAPGGGVFAIVGERGLGKSTVLGRIEREAPNVTMVECPFGGMEAFIPAFLKSLRATDDASLEIVAEAYDASQQEEAGILIDDAHRLIKPMMGGLRDFDRVLAVARRYSKNVAWVFAFDDVIWRFFERIRGAQPLFDEIVHLRPWQEEAIARLIVGRSDTVGIAPSFEQLVGDLPGDADDIDLQEALDRTEASYYRLIWDYTGGNPGAALHVWRSLLGVAGNGVHCVKVFRAPRTDALELLPDPAVFVLRALVQLERAKPEAISRATGISLPEVEDALRFGLVRGYFRITENGYAVQWAWFRVITRFLQRRHLLFAE